jgi:hypothetical protein
MITHELDKKLAETIEDCFVNNKDLLGPLVSYVLINGRSEHLSVKVAAQRARFVKDWLSEEIRIATWIAFKKHLDALILKKDNVVEKLLPTMIKLGKDQAAIFVISEMEKGDRFTIEAICNGFFLSYLDIGWPKENLSAGNYYMLYKWFKAAVDMHPSDNVFVWLLSALVSFADPSNLEEVTDRLVKTVETGKNLAEAQAYMCIRCLVKTYGWAVVQALIEKKFTDSSNFVKVKKDVEKWQSRIDSIQNKSRS